MRGVICHAHLLLWVLQRSKSVHRPLLRLYGQWHWIFSGLSKAATAPGPARLAALGAEQDRSMQALVLFRQALDENHFKQQRWVLTGQAPRRVEVRLFICSCIER